MTTDELHVELRAIILQIARNEVGTPNVYVRQNAIETELAKRKTEGYDIIHINRKTEMQLNKLMKELQAQGHKEVKTADDVLTYLLDEFEKHEKTPRSKSTPSIVGPDGERFFD